MKVVAEGVETRAQLDWLRSQGCHLAQGFHIAKPLRPEELRRTGLLLARPDGDSVARRRPAGGAATADA